MDVEINFQKLVCNVGDSGFELACMDVVAVDCEEGSRIDWVGVGLA